jgi:hypothetical protein
VPLDSARGYRLGSIALVVVATAWHGWVASGAMWRLDDWVYLIRVDMSSFPEYVLQDYNGHAMPLQFAFLWMFTKLFPMSFTAQAVTIAALTALGIAAWAVAFAEIFGPRLRLLLPLSVIALTPISLFSASFWASAVQLFPLQAFMGVAVLYAARAARGVPGSAWRLALTYAVALLWWEKSLLMVMPVTAVVVLCGRGGIREHLRALVPVAAVTALYVPGYLWVRGRVDEQVPTWIPYSDSLSERAVEYARHSWSVVPDLLVPALLGGPWGTVPILGDFYRRPERLLTIGLSVLLVILVALAVRRRGRRAWVPLALAVGYVLTASTLIMFSTKYQLLGPDALYEDRYFPDVVVVLMLCGAMLTSPLRDEPAPAVAATRAGGAARHRLLGIGAGGALLVSLGIANAQLWPQMPPEPGRAWVETVRDQLEQVGPASVRDTVPPAEVLQAGLWPDGFKVSRMFASLDPEARFGAPGNPVLSLTPDGTLHPSTIRSSIAAEPGPQPDCGYYLGDGKTVEVPLTQSLFGHFWGVELAVFSGSGGELTIDIDGETQHVTIPQGLSSPQFLRIGTVSELSVRLDGPDASACLAAVHAGEVVDEVG